MAFKMSGFSGFKKTIAKDKSFEDEEKKYVHTPDDDSVPMTPEQEKKHIKGIDEYNRTKSKPLTEARKTFFKNKIKDPKTPESTKVELKKILALPKNN